MDMIALMRSFKLDIFMMQLTIIGFGNQAKSWSQNLKDSGFPVLVALKVNSPSIALAHELGFQVVILGTKEFYAQNAFALLTPDHTHVEFMQEHGPQMQAGSVMLYAHGFSLVKNKFQQSFPQIHHILFAPKAIGSELRRQFQLKGKLGAVYSLEHVQEEATQLKDWVFELSKNLGINMGPYPTSFLRETRADLYSEQGLLCSLIPYTAGEMFSHLVDSGTEPELAYFECWHELKLIVNAMVDKGPEGFFDLISPNALIGSEKGFQKLITPEFKKNLRNLLLDIESGEFDQEIEKANVEEIRHTIRSRWSKTALMKTFHQINQDEK